MKLQALRVLLDELYDGFNGNKEVFISTEKQMLPNAMYDFEVAESGGVIELNPVLRKS